ncbi:hypothetical protein K2173_010564 [Erythroxylum novogranatense]|uniref:Lipid droplet-associated hydrolase n=1 Tax=Erythroxylum novogranatense TaxID=1862640 RepID=A0AAV8UAQ5_9ROSI|nr:hypothetical protein K2173_010564 [Erythroxylum novogranatense]
MARDKWNSKTSRLVRFRLCNVSSYTTELLEIVSQDPALHVLFIPGNPGLAFVMILFYFCLGECYIGGLFQFLVCCGVIGVVSFYKDFLESLYEFLGGTASVTVIGHISHTKKNWEGGKLFSLQQQIDHKVDFIQQELQKKEIPIVLVGHSIGAYISIETLRRCQDKVIYYVGLYPFLMFNPLSKKQPTYKKVSESPVISALLSFCIGSLGLLPKCARRSLVSKTIGKSWSAPAIDAACSHLLRYHTFRNMLFLAQSEFRELSEAPDWTFMRENKRKITFLFGVDDHWGPLEMYEEISKQVPEICMSIERQGLAHSFCCTEAGSVWIARHVTSLIKNIR